MLNNKINKDKLLNQKKKYLFLLIIMIIGIISGILFLFFISKDDKTLLMDELNQFFISIKDNSLNTTNTLLNSISSNFLSIVIVWLLGISIIGIPFIVFFLFFKSFVFSFSMASIIAKYGFKGILLSFSYIFPHQLFYLVIWLLLSFYALSFSFKLGRLLIFKKNINIREYFIKYLKIGSLCLIVSVICSLFETYITPHFINLFIF